MGPATRRRPRLHQVLHKYNTRAHTAVSEQNSSPIMGVRRAGLPRDDRSWPKVDVQQCRSIPRSFADVGNISRFEL